MITKAQLKKDKEEADRKARECSRAREAAESEARRYKAELDKKAEEDKKRYSATVYCTNCLHVNDVSIPPGVTIAGGDCVTCRVRGQLKVVITYPGK